MEMLDLYNNDGELLNKTIVRGDKNLLEGENIKLATIWILNDDKYLIQKCSLEKGGEYAVTGGHVQAGKTSDEQACLELQEELNIEVEPHQLTFIGNMHRGHAIFDGYLLDAKVLKTQNFSLQKEEVEEVMWLTKSEIEKLITNNLFRKSSEVFYQKFIKNS